jgi:8-oxo-dGTP pyrophosphatase MutT (NUDIX family)
MPDSEIDRGATRRRPRERFALAGALALAVVASLATPRGAAMADQDIDSAGIIVYTRIQGTTYVLIADHVIGRARGWAAFGGRREAGEEIAAAALRELHEETRCVYRDAALTLGADAAYVDVGTYRSYVLEVPFVPATVFQASTAPPGCHGPAYQERGPWAWIPKDVLLAAIRSTTADGTVTLPERYLPDGGRRWFWPASARVIERLAERDAIP